ncbi:MAG: hypothetical protein V5A64_02450 [Candidatus Thermoplasmatota archaeon]
MVEDDLSKLGVAPSDRKKLESMGMTTLKQIALQSTKTLGMGNSKGTRLIQRARNILANENILDINIKDEDTVEVEVKGHDRAIRKAILNMLNVYAAGWGNASLETKENILVLNRESQKFDKVLQKAEAVQEMIQTKRRKEEEKRGITLPEDELKEFAKERGFDGFWKNVFQEIHGNDVMKKVISASMFSTFEEPVHSLIIGEPGSSKTMAMDIIKEEFSNATTVGANTTRSGLVCNLGTGDLGALPHANEKLVLVDEFDKIPEEDIEYCYELLSNGKCTVHSAKLHKDIESHFIMIAFANPKTKVFGEDAISDIGLSPLLMSRCALVVKVANISRDERRNLFRKKFYGGNEFKKKHDYYDQWVKLAREFQPDITASEETVDNYIDEINSLVDEHYDTKLRRDLRMSEYIRRIPMAIARASFSPVDDEIVAKSLQIIKESIKTWS